MKDNTRTGAAYQRSGYSAHGGRRAGSGVWEDDYSEDSFGGGGPVNIHEWPRFPNDDVKPEDLNGPCIIVCEGEG